jgi:hypothetical protein
MKPTFLFAASLLAAAVTLAFFAPVMLAVQAHVLPYIAEPGSAQLLREFVRAALAPTVDGTAVRVLASLGAGFGVADLVAGFLASVVDAFVASPARVARELTSRVGARTREQTPSL